MITINDALTIIRSAAERACQETVEIENCVGRVCAEDVIAPRDQPPFRVSAMDGFAVRFEDAKLGASLRLFGSAPAGTPFGIPVPSNSAVRIFTGGVVPDSLDHIIIQEDATIAGDRVIVEAEQTARKNIRDKGIDFRRGRMLARVGKRLSSFDIGLLAASGRKHVQVTRRPVIAVIDCGNELVEPGEGLEFGQIVGSNRFSLACLVRHFGGIPEYIGRALDNPDSMQETLSSALFADFIVVVGGASVGAHDYARDGFDKIGGKLRFSRVSIRPGKPTWFGCVGKTMVLGLPGNPASTNVCALIFLKTAIQTVLGETDVIPQYQFAQLSSSVPANGPREAFIRGRAQVNASGQIEVAAIAIDDSSLQTPFVDGNCLIRLPPNSLNLEPGETLEILLFAPLLHHGAGEMTT